MKFGKSLVYALATVGVAWAGALHGLTYVNVSDLGLTEQADVIVRVEVVDSRVVTSENSIVTEYSMLVRDLLKGDVSGAFLDVRVPGGHSEELGVVLEYFGAPSFERDGRALLFLKGDPDGTFHVLHFVLGYFQERLESGAPVFVRDLPETAIRPGSRAHVGRDVERFMEWIRSTVSGRESPIDYLVELSEEARGAGTADFTVRMPSYIAWTQFHQSPAAQVIWKRHKSGQKGVPGKGKKELAKVFKALNKTRDSRDGRSGLVNFSLKGKVSTKKLPDNLATECVGDNFFVFNDAIGIRDDFVCTGNQVGGVLASGGSCRTVSPVGSWKGESLYGASSGRVIFNANTACFYQGNPPFGGDSAANKFSEVAIHEVLHTLGLLHSCGDSSSPKCSKSDVLDDATMRANIHADGRGPSMRVDDLAGFWQLYDPDFFAAGCDVEPGNKKFCKRCGPCGEGQGRCTKSKQCFGSLKCRTDSALGFKTCQQ